MLKATYSDRSPLWAQGPMTQGGRTLGTALGVGKHDMGVGGATLERDETVKGKRFMIVG